MMYEFAHLHQEWVDEDTYFYQLTLLRTPWGPDYRKAGENVGTDFDEVLTMLGMRGWMIAATYPALGVQRFMLQRDIADRRLDAPYRDTAPLVPDLPPDA